MNESTKVSERELEQLEETVWVIRAQAGDRDAYVSLMKRYERPLLYYLRRLVPEGEVALDLHQEVWISVFRGLPSLHAAEAFRVWLFRIAHHKAARFVRNEMRKEQLTDSLAVLVDPESTSLEAYVFDAEAVQKALAIVPLHHREILTLHYLDALSTAEVGRILDCPSGTVKSRLHYARSALRRVIETMNL